MSEYALVFPGQGSQSVGMGRELAESDPAARAVFEEASAALGFDVTALCLNGPAKTLKQTINAQPAILTISIAALAALEARLGKSLQPKLAAGHSLGHFSALVGSNALNLPDALILVRERGRLMQEAGDSSPGAMAAILGFDEAILGQICDRVNQLTDDPSQSVIIANYNSPGQLVISGDITAVEKAGQLAREAGARRVMPLEVSGAFHSPLMAQAAFDFGTLVGRVVISTAAYPVVSNVSARLLSGPSELRDDLRQQLTAPVRWIDSVQLMASEGVTHFIELGPGSVLAGLIRRISPSATTHSALSPKSIDEAASLIQSLA